MVSSIMEDEDREVEKTEDKQIQTLEIQSIQYEGYKCELQMPDIMRLIQADLSEPYSIYTYRYFIHNWPNLCYIARHGSKYVGAIVCKLDYHKGAVTKRGYIAMLAVDENYRKRKIGATLVKKAIEAMILDMADEVVLETEVTNKAALQLYERLGFVRDKRLFRYYLNGVDALRLKLWLK
ncbi:N-alpha-acetyltransferase 30-like [Eurytemora carolleeae]|uniref:N-alpha-acetyltransferase 30-like n=1 Tax=Eurytemora carolleeae TaxID=1294199 RepID=UPI000C773158|nr:N-alpha-acetyltransferase 30-like [Eurytemora carolleeae]|eukprot:XP_023320330.1 N-alpha-acetyltransferase 30-like [Eurytemora affinis]